MRNTISAALFAVSATVAASAVSLDTAPFGKMLPFTVSGYAGTSTLENFPVLVRLSTAIDDFDYGDVGATADAALASLRFADEDGNSLNYEIDTWDAAGESLVWVSVPEISGQATRFFAYFKADASATLPAVDPAAVWTDAGYFGVWHFGSVDETDGSAADSSGNGLVAAPAAVSGAPALRTDGAGVVGAYVKSNAGLFLPSDEIVNFADTKTDYTVEAWVNRSVENGGDQQIMRCGDTWQQGAGLRLNDRIFYGNGNYTQWSGSYPVSLTGWTFLAGAFSTTQSGYLQLNGDYPLASVTRGNNNTAFSSFSLTSRTGGTEPFKGYADEFRLRRGLSHKDWSMAVYESARAGSTFLSAGTVATLDAAVTGLDGAATGVAWTEATIVGAFAAADPTAYSATYALSTNGVALRTDVAAGPLGAGGFVSVALDGLVPGTRYDFVFDVAVDGETTVYSAGSFTTEALPDPAVSGIGATTATVSLAATLSGASYAAGTVTAVFTPIAGGRAVSVPAAFADGSWTAAATTLESDQDYTAAVVVAPSGSAGFSTASSAPFRTTGTARVSESAFRRNMEIVVSGYAGTSTLTNFPVLVRVSADVAAKVPDVSGIRFALADGTLLAHEIESWNPEGESAIWVSIPFLSGTDTAFKMLWAPDPAAAVHGAFAPARVWTAAGYAGVWHFNEQNADGSYPDASGHGATAVPVAASKTPNAPETATVSTNGTPWHFANVGLKVAPENAGDWTFAAPGYTTEAWLVPSADYNRMFLYADGNNTGNANAFGRSYVYVMVSSGYDNVGWTAGPLTDAATWNKTWRFVTTVWRNADGDWFTRFYENGASKYVWSGAPNKKAVDFTANGMGLTSGTAGNGSMNYSVDEIRVRRGNSTDDWVQANYDTQVLGSGFLSYGKVSAPAGTVVMVR